MQPELPLLSLAVYFFLPGGSVGWAAGAKLSDPPPQLRIIPGCIDPPNTRLLEPEIFHTTDGGIHWLKQSVPQTGGCPFGTLFFKSEREGLAVSGSRAYYTEDRGQTWISADFPENCNRDLSPGESNEQRSFNFNGTKTGWLSSAYGFLWKTVDGGKSWCELRGVQTGGGGLYLGGSSWSGVTGPEDVNDLNCTGGQCWAVAGGKLYRMKR